MCWRTHRFCYICKCTADVRNFGPTSHSPPRSLVRPALLEIFNILLNCRGRSLAVLVAVSFRNGKCVNFSFADLTSCIGKSIPGLRRERGSRTSVYLLDCRCKVCPPRTCFVLSPMNSGPQVHCIEAFSQRLVVLDPKLLTSLLTVSPDFGHTIIKGMALGILLCGEFFPGLSCQLDDLFPISW